MGFESPTYSGSPSRLASAFCVLRIFAVVSSLRFDQGFFQRFLLPGIFIRAFLPVLFRQGLWPVFFDQRFLPVLLDQGFLPIFFDQGFVSVNFDQGLSIFKVVLLHILRYLLLSFFTKWYSFFAIIRGRYRSCVVVLLPIFDKVNESFFAAGVRRVRFSFVRFGRILVFRVFIEPFYEI